MRKCEGMSESKSSPPANRYPAADEWQVVDRYFTDPLVGEDDALIATRRSGAATSTPNAEVAANQGAFLGLLVKIAGAKRVFEFGTLAGYWPSGSRKPRERADTSSHSNSNRRMRQSLGTPIWRPRHSRPSARRDGTDSSSRVGGDAN